jgi:hypothetical protein
MEVYLSHMVIFRGLEKLHINIICGNGWVQYTVTVILTICGAVAFSVVVKKVIELLGRNLIVK